MAIKAFLPDDRQPACRILLESAVAIGSNTRSGDTHKVDVPPRRDDQGEGLLDRRYRQAVPPHRLCREADAGVRPDRVLREAAGMVGAGPHPQLPSAAAAGAARPGAQESYRPGEAPASAGEFRPL